MNFHFNFNVDLDVLLITTGWPFYGRSRTEVIHIGDFQAVCQDMPDYRVQCAGAVGGLLYNHSHNQQIPLVCGGSGNVDKCYVVGQEEADAEDQVSITMRYARKQAASVVINEGTTLWITGGGTPVGITRTTEYVTMSGSIDGPDLPMVPKVDRHCMVAMSPMETILIGGRFNRDKAWSHNATTGDWTLMGDMVLSHENAPCGVLEDSVELNRTIILATTANGSTEIMVHGYGDGANEWTLGPAFPTSIKYGSLVTTKDRKRLVAFGYDDGVWHSALFYQITCHSLQCQWRKMPQEMAQARREVVGFLIPDHMGNCHIDESITTTSTSTIN